MAVYSDINQTIVRNVGSGNIILDVGCGSGVLGEELKKRGNIVYGVDYSHEAIKLARKRLDDAAIFDIERGGKFPFAKKFGIIIFADVLEHLLQPHLAVEYFKKYLSKGGAVIISVPNISNWTVRIKLLFGIFTYTETGILDKTHVHFYTLKTIKKFAEECGLDIEKISVNPNFIRSFLNLKRKFFAVTNRVGSDEDILKSDSYRRYIKYILPIENVIAGVWKGLFAYQFVLFCKVNPDIR